MPVRRKQGGGPSYDSSSVAYFAAMAAAGYNATDREKAAADKFIRTAKANGLWSKFDRCYLHIGNLASMLICCKSLTSRVAVNSPVATSLGLGFNGSSNYARSDVNLSALTNLQANSAHAFSMFAGGSAPGNTIFGATVGSDRFYIHGGLVS